MPRFAVVYEHGDRWHYINLVEMQPWAYNYKHPLNRVRQKAVLRLLARKRHRYVGDNYIVFRWAADRLTEIPLSYDAVLATEGEEGLKAFVANMIREVMDGASS